MKSELAEAWGSFLAGYPWDWFLTLTFREPAGTFRAHRLFQRFAADVEKAANVSTGWFRADECGNVNGRLHMHALMLNVGHLPRLYWMNEWDKRAGFARILPFDPSKGAAFYCSKYVTKDLGDYDFSDGLSAFKGARPATQPTLFLPSAQSKPDRNSRPQLSGASRPQFQNNAEDWLIAKLDGAVVEQPPEPQMELLEGYGEDR
ncbi:MAG: hypothetical protein ABIR70_17960 [Bryobacteraceae bacterium]